MSTEAKNVEFVKDLYAAFGRGDLPYILERFAPELESFGVTAGGRATGLLPELYRDEFTQHGQRIPVLVATGRFLAAHDVGKGGDADAYAAQLDLDGIALEVVIAPRSRGHVRDVEGAESRREIPDLRRRKRVRVVLKRQRRSCPERSQL